MSPKAKITVKKKFPPKDTLYGKEIVKKNTNDLAKMASIKAHMNLLNEELSTNGNQPLSAAQRRVVLGKLNRTINCAFNNYFPNIQVNDDMLIRDYNRTVKIEIIQILTAIEHALHYYEWRKNIIESGKEQLLYSSLAEDEVCHRVQEFFKEADLSLALQKRHLLARVQDFYNQKYGTSNFLIYVSTW